MPLHMTQFTNQLEMLLIPADVKANNMTSHKVPTILTSLYLLLAQFILIQLYDVHYGGSVVPGTRQWLHMKRQLQVLSCWQ